MERALTGQTAAIDVESGGLETGPSGVPIGRDRARDTVVNCVLPFLHASASLSRDDRLTASCLQAYSRFPRLQENELTREMMRQLFPDLAGGEGRWRGGCTAR